MAYSELIKDFSRIRTYLRSFYIYGFQHREEFRQKSARSYDNERRRVESWLGEYMAFRQDQDGRRVFLSVDSRSISENPLFRAFRTKSFTDRDITLHFQLLDILRVTGGLSITGMMDELADRLSEFEEDAFPDEATVRRKLREYVALGIVGMEKNGRETVYLPCTDTIALETWETAAAFFSEAAPLGVIGAFLQDRLPGKRSWFRFKHHYILNALDSEALYTLFSAIGEERQIHFTARRRHVTALPLKIYISTQTGRQHFLAWSPENGRFSFYRVDLMDRVEIGDRVEIPAGFPEKLRQFQAHAWGVTGNNRVCLEHLEMTVFAGPGEEHIPGRLEREKRCGTVEQLDDTHWRFSADVYDALEMLPWLRTFTGRITALSCTDRRVISRFQTDLEDLTVMYGGKEHAVS